MDGGRGVHPLGEGAGVIEGNDDLKLDRPFGGDVTDLVDLLHGAGKVLHHRSEAHRDALAHGNAVFIGIAEIEGELQLLVVDQGGHFGAAAHRLVDAEILYVDQLTGKGRFYGQVGGLLLELGQLLIQGIYLFLGVGHGFFSGLAVNGVEGLSGSDHVARRYKEFPHRAALAEGDGRRLLGFGVAAAADGTLDGADLGGHGVNFSLLHRCGTQEKIPD